MKYLIIFLLLSSPAHAMEQWEIEQLRAEQRALEDQYQRQVMEADIAQRMAQQEAERQMRTPAERLTDCAYAHDCGGEFGQ